MLNCIMTHNVNPKTEHDHHDILVRHICMSIDHIDIQVYMQCYILFGNNSIPFNKEWFHQVNICCFLIVALIQSHSM